MVGMRHAQENPDGRGMLARVARIVERRLLDCALPPDEARGIAADTVRDLQGAFGGVTVYVPRVRSDVAAQAAQAHAMALAGASVIEIARQLGVTQRYAYLLLARHRDNPGKGAAGARPEPANPRGRP